MRIRYRVWAMFAEIASFQISRDSCMPHVAGVSPSLCEMDDRGLYGWLRQGDGV